MTSRYTAWNGQSYPWPPPPRWHCAGDGRWWPVGQGPAQAAGGGARKVVAWLLVSTFGFVVLYALVGGSSSRDKLAEAGEVADTSCDRVSVGPSRLVVFVPDGDSMCARAAGRAIGSLGFSESDVDRAVFAEAATNDDWRMRLDASNGVMQIVVSER